VSIRGFPIFIWYLIRGEMDVPPLILKDAVWGLDRSIEQTKYRGERFSKGAALSENQDEC
jgi:hypothetical protein